MTNNRTLSFESRDLNDAPFHFDSSRGNGHCKILLFIDALVGPANITRLQNWVGFIKHLLATRPVIEHGVDLIPCLYLARVAALADRNMVRSVIGQTLDKLGITVDVLGDTMVVDWDGKMMRQVRDAIGRLSNPDELLSSRCPEFEQHSVWMVVTDENNSIVSAAFSLPTPQEDSEAFAEFINDVVAAVPNAQIQNEIVAGYNDFYQQG